MTNSTTDSKQGEALEFVRVQGVLKAVSEFCDGTQPFVGERFKKQLRNTIRAVPRASLAAEEENWQPIATVPKNGDEVLLAHANSQWFDQWISDVTGDYAEGGYWMMCDQWEDPETPTHWKLLSPLPNPAAVSSPLPAPPPNLAELDQVLVEAMIEDPVGVRLTELQLEQMDRDAAEPRQEGEQEGDGLGGDEPFCGHGNLLWSEACDQCIVESFKVTNEITNAATTPETPVVAREIAADIVRDKGIWHLFNPALDPVMAHDRLIDRLEAIITHHLAGTPPASFIEVFRNTAIKLHGAYGQLVRLKPRLHDEPLEHQGPWEECDWIECEDRRKMIAELDAATPSPETPVGGEPWSDIDNWPIPSVLEHLAGATEHLLRDHDCDEHGWETWKYAAEAARTHVALLNAAPVVSDGDDKEEKS